MILYFLVSPQARQHFAMAELDGMIYVLGGENEDTEVLLTMEVFDPHCNVWRTQPKMTTVRKVRFSSSYLYKSTHCNTLMFLILLYLSIPQFGSCATMKKRLYVMGGGSYGKIYDSVECYDPKTQQWTTVCPLKERR